MILLLLDDAEKHNLHQSKNQVIDQCQNKFGIPFHFENLGLEYSIVTDISGMDNSNAVIIYDISFFGNINLYIEEALPLIKPNIIDNVKSLSNFFIVFSCSQEGFNINLEIIKSWCITHNISENKIILITGNSNYQKIYKDINHNFNIFYFPFFMRQSQQEIKNFKEKLIHKSIINNMNRQYYWLSLNKVPRSHRIVHLGFIHKYGIQDKFLWSLSNDNHGTILDYKNDIVRHLFWLEDLELKTWLEEKFLDFVQYPKPLDIPDFNNCKATKLFSESLFTNSFFSVVTETDISPDITFISEKIWKPIINLQPFIVIGNPYTLKFLRQYGFESFPEIFDESYDLELNQSKRIEMINSEILRISKLNIKKIQELYSSVKGKLIKNRNIICLNNNLYNDEINFKEFLLKRH